MSGLSVDKIVILGIIAVFVLGPERLPYYASKLAQLVRSVRGLADTAKDRMRDEMGPDFDDVDWKRLDPRQYDPRQIIRQALLEDDSNPVARPPKPVEANAEPVPIRPSSDSLNLTKPSPRLDKPQEISVSKDPGMYTGTPSVTPGQAIGSTIRR